jgi:threonine/homoserine/homoserine lactone efflux protein
VTIAIGLGFAAAIEESPKLFILIKWIGSAYVLYLAWRFFRAGAIEETEDERSAGFLGGGLLLLLNPKAYAIIFLMFTQFLIATQIEYTTAVLWISSVFTLNNLVAFITWAVIGDQIIARFRDETNSRMLNVGFGVALALVAIWMMLG